MDITIVTGHSPRLPSPNLDTLAELFDAVSQLRGTGETESQLIAVSHSGSLSQPLP